MSTEPVAAGEHIRNRRCLDRERLQRAETGERAGKVLANAEVFETDAINGTSRQGLGLQTREHHVVFDHARAALTVEAVGDHGAVEALRALGTVEPRGAVVARCTIVAVVAARVLTRRAIGV